MTINYKKKRTSHLDLAFIFGEMFVTGLECRVHNLKDHTDTQNVIVFRFWLKFDWGSNCLSFFLFDSW